MFPDHEAGLGKSHLRGPVRNPGTAKGAVPKRGVAPGARTDLRGGTEVVPGTGKSGAGAGKTICSKARLLTVILFLTFLFCECRDRRRRSRSRERRRSKSPRGFGRGRRSPPRFGGGGRFGRGFGRSRSKSPERPAEPQVRTTERYSVAEKLTVVKY